MPRTHRPIVLAIGLLLAASAASALGTPVPVRGATQTVTIADSAFGPTTLTVTVGDTVTWTNVDSRPHTVTADGGQFDSGNLDSGASFSHTFVAPGTYTYRCQYHGQMQATIVVEAAAGVAAPAATLPAQGSTAGGTPAVVTPAGGDQPDTALPVPGLDAFVPMLLIGLGLVALAFGLVPLGSRRRHATVQSGGWRR